MIRAQKPIRSGHASPLLRIRLRGFDGVWDGGEVACPLCHLDWSGRQAA